MTVKLLITLASLKTSRVRRASPGLSSTSRISIGLEFISFSLRPRNREQKCRALSKLRFHPNSSSVTFYDLSADGQTDAGAGVFLARVKPLEHLKDTLEVLRLDADPVVLDGKHPSVFHGCSGNLDFRLPFVAVFDRVPDQILEQLCKLRGICAHSRQRTGLHHGSGFRDGCPKIGNGLLARSPGVGHLEFFALRGDA